MMDFSPARPKRQRHENIVPMINVVFLLLIFFLMSAQIAPPDPFELSVPQAESGSAAPPADTLFVSADGTLAYNSVTGPAALNEVATRPPEGSLKIRADGSVNAAVLAELLHALSRAGVDDVLLLTRTP